MDVQSRLYQKYHALGVSAEGIGKMLKRLRPQEVQIVEFDQGFFWDKYQDAQRNIENRVQNPYPNPSYYGEGMGHTGGYSGNEDVALNQAIQDSLRQNQVGSYEPLTLEQRFRKSGDCIGLKNIGNTCYFNSLLQTMFRIKWLVQQVLEARVPQTQAPLPAEATADQVRQRGAREMCREMQDLFVNMIASNLKYVDPTGIINRLVDENGQPIKIGEQKDIVEVMVAVLERLEEVVGSSQRGREEVNMSIDEGVLDERNNMNKYTTVRTLSGRESTNIVSPGGPKLRTVTGDSRMSSNLNQSMTDPRSVNLSQRNNLWNNTGDAHFALADSGFLSSKLKTTINVQSDSIIRKLFFGRSLSHIIRGSQESTGSEELFGPVILDPNTGDFYRSWENFFMTEINEMGDCYKWDLVTRMPDILTFQINRVSFNLELKVPQKNNRKFEFPASVYTDRFLLDNKFTLQSIRMKKMKLEQQIADLDASIQNIEAHDDHTNLVTSVKALQSYLSAQSSFSTRIIDALSHLEVDLEKTLYDNKQRRDAVMAELKSIFGKIEKNRYSVFSIIMHEGAAESGHYYCFIKMTQNVWIKFNDFNTKQFTENEVMELAYGGKANSSASAYCVFYMRDDMLGKSLPHSYSHDKRDGYFTLLSPDKIAETELKNNQLLKVVQI